MKHKPQLSDVMTAEPETVHLGQPLSEFSYMNRIQRHAVVQPPS